MSHRLRLLGSGLSAALVAGALAAAPTPAGAAAHPVAIYSCVPTLGGVVPVTLPPVDMPVNLDVLDSVTVPVGGTLGQISGTLGVQGLLSSLGGAASSLLGAGGLAVTLAGDTYQGAVASSGAVSVPALPVPDTAGSFPVTLPPSLTVHGLLGTASCTIKGADDVITTLLVTAPANPGGPGTDGGGRGPVTPGGGSEAVVNPSRPNPCVTAPRARAGQRPTKLSAKAGKVSWKRRPSVKVAATSRRKPARGTVIACYGAMKIGQRNLRHGKATLRTLRFYPGHYWVKLVYLGGGKARPKTRMVALRVKG
ncbi:hypothetical protein JCM18899A_17080 [Nocardioides sp. AN3]